MVNRFAGHRLLRDRPQLLPVLSPSHLQRLSHCPLPVAKHWNVAVVLNRYEVITSKKALGEVRRNHRVDRDTQGCRPPLDSAQWRLVPREVSAMRPMEEGNLEMSVMWPCADYFSYASAWKVKIDEKATATKLARTRNARTRLLRFKGNKPLVLMKPRPRSDIWPGSATHS